MIASWLVIATTIYMVNGDRVKDVTGAGITDGVYAMYGADLGISRWDSARNATAVMFGDNFEFRYLQGEWRSPSIMMYNSNYDVLGIPTSGNGISRSRVRQLWPYTHNNPEYSTILPCDFIKIGSTWYVAVMVTKGLGNELRTEFWRSNDLVSWSGPILSLRHPGHPGNVMLTFDVIGDYVYIFGTGGLKRNMPIYMWRNPVSVFPMGYWEPWGWNGSIWGWGIANENTPILTGAYGELAFRSLNGKSVLSFFDAGGYRCSAIVVPTPTSNWYVGRRIDFATGATLPQLYGCHVTWDSRLDTTNGMKFIVSQWITSTNDPYKSILFQDTLRS